jgi:hypothetical protein
LRVWLEIRDVFHVLATRCNDTVPAGGFADAPVDDLIAAIPTRPWRRRSCGNDAHGPRVYDWAWVPIRPLHAPGRGHWVLARRSVSDGEIAYYVCYGRARTTLDELISVAGSRGAIEECFQAAKNEAGLDHYQARTYLRLVPARHPVDVRPRLSRRDGRRQSKGAPTACGQHPAICDDHELIPLTVNEIRRLLATLILTRQFTPDRVTPGYVGADGDRPKPADVITGDAATRRHKCRCSIRRRAGFDLATARAPGGFGWRWRE